jgi:preprotein translocase subunit SecB
MKEVVTDLFQKSGFKQFSFTKEVNFQELYNQQFSS